MPETISLGCHISGLVERGVIAPELAGIITALDRVGKNIARLVARGQRHGGLADCLKPDNGAGDAQKKLDVIAHEMIVEALRAAPVAWIASEESIDSIRVHHGAPFSIAIDPVDGSSNIETNAPIGTIFSILPTAECGSANATFLQPGSNQVAAGFFVYGPQCSLLLTFGHGTDSFTLDPDSGTFLLSAGGMRIAADTQEFAINYSNIRHWCPSLSNYISDCVLGGDGPRGKDYNMRWIASLVAEAQRILVRGGIYLYPRDKRRGYEDGRLRLIYEANPVGLLMEQAGGGATNGRTRILDLVPTHIHQRTPFIFGSLSEVERVGRYLRGHEGGGEAHALFSHRGLFRH